MRASSAEKSHRIVAAAVASLWRRCGVAVAPLLASRKARGDDSLRPGFFESSLGPEELEELRAGGDVVIGSVAIALGGGVATANARDFQRMQGLRVDAWPRG